MTDFVKLTFEENEKEDSKRIVPSSEESNATGEESDSKNSITTESLNSSEDDSGFDGGIGPLKLD